MQVYLVSNRYQEIGNKMAAAVADVKLEDFSNIFRLDGKVAVVTGGSRGLGLHVASGYIHSRSSTRGY